MNVPDARIGPDFRMSRGEKRVRFDQGSARGPDIAPGGGSLLGAFGAWGARAARSVVGTKSAPAAPAERRDTDRHEEVECKAWVGWKTWRRFHMNDALVINLSRGGAQIFLDTPPPGKRPVWVFLETPAQNTIVKARVVEVQLTAMGQCAIRVAFHESCPYVLFEAAVCGLAAADPRRRMASAPKAKVGTPGRRIAV